MSYKFEAPSNSLALLLEARGKRSPSLSVFPLSLFLDPCLQCSTSTADQEDQQFETDMIFDNFIVGHRVLNSSRETDKNLLHFRQQPGKVLSIRRGTGPVSPVNS